MQRPLSLLKQAYWNAWYRYVSRADRDRVLTFMNYGYQGAERTELRPEDEPNRYAIQLYERVVRALPGNPADMTLLEVGCGRGGGLSHVARHLAVGRAIGVDLCAAAIDFCRSARPPPNVSFLVGDAAQLPVGDGEADAVINVESSHRYPDMGRFLAEVRRVLRRRGHFSFADFRATARMNALREEFARSGLKTLSEESITAPVLRALELDDRRKRDLIEAFVPRVLRKAAREFASVVGSASYRSLAGGRREYVRFLLQKA